jgi:hypothetical protein
MSFVMIIPLIILVLLIWRRIVGQAKYVVVGVFLLLMVQRAVTPADDWYHFSILLLLSALHYGVLGFMILVVMRYHLLTYVCFLWLGFVFRSEGFLESDLSIYQINGAVMLVLGVLPLLMAFLAWRKTTANP